MKRTFLATVAVALIISTLHSQTIKSPGEFLGYEPGTSYEGRPLGENRQGVDRKYNTQVKINDRKI